jgi:hypothetical protein
LARIALAAFGIVAARYPNPRDLNSDSGIDAIVSKVGNLFRPGLPANGSPISPKVRIIPEIRERWLLGVQRNEKNVSTGDDGLIILNPGN